MPKIPIIKAKDFFKYITKFNCTEISIRGSHHKVRNNVNGKISIIAIHNNEDLNQSMIKADLKQIGMDINDFIDFMENRNKLLKNRTISELLEGIINYKLGKVLIKLSKINENNNWNSLNKEEKLCLSKNIISHKLDIVGTNSFDNAQTASGGIPLSEVDIDTMESKIVDNLYIIGEILDADGECGGYNLGFCFLTGIKVGNSIK